MGITFKYDEIASRYSWYTGSERFRQIIELLLPDLWLLQQKSREYDWGGEWAPAHNRDFGRNCSKLLLVVEPEDDTPQSEAVEYSDSGNWFWKPRVSSVRLRPDGSCGPSEAHRNENSWSGLALPVSSGPEGWILQLQMRYLELRYSRLLPDLQAVPV